MKTINFSRSGMLSLVLSIIVIGIGFAITVFGQGGFNLGIDFQSGISASVAISPPEGDPPTPEEVRAVLEGLDGAVGVQNIEEGRGRYLIRITTPAAAAAAAATDADGESDTSALLVELETLLSAEYGEMQVEILESAFVGPRFSRTIARQSIALTLVALLIIMLYIWLRFRFRFSVSAVTALLHDVLMTIAFLGVTQIELSTTTIAATLTIIGYSLNDTVVIFDRIRENARLRQKDVGFRQLVDRSITQSLSRTIVTSLTTLLAVAAIYLFSRGSIRDFAITMIFGIFIGTYSSVFIAAPFLELLTKGDITHIQAKRRAKEEDGGTMTQISGQPTSSSSDGGGKPRALPAGSGSGTKASGGDAALSTSPADSPSGNADVERIRRELRQRRQQQGGGKKKKKR